MCYFEERKKKSNLFVFQTTFSLQSVQSNKIRWLVVTHSEAGKNNIVILKGCVSTSSNVALKKAFTPLTCPFHFHCTKKCRQANALSEWVFFCHLLHSCKEETFAAAAATPPTSFSIFILYQMHFLLLCQRSHIRCSNIASQTIQCDSFWIIWNACNSSITVFTKVSSIWLNQNASILAVTKLGR